MYEIGTRYNNLLELLEDESIPQETVNAALQQVSADVANKCESGIAYMQMLESTIAGAKAEKKRLDAYIKRLEARQERIQQAYINFLHMLDKKAVMTKAGEMKVKKSPAALVIDDATKIPGEYERTTITTTYDKMAIKQAMKEGREIEGCHLEQRERLSY
jgi:hypothetical protein